MPTYTAPTTRTTGELISAAIFNTDLVENIKYFKDAPAFAGNVTVAGTLGVTGATTLSSATYTTSLKSTTALATPAALTATQATAFASTVSGSAIMGFGTTNDVSLMNRAGTVVLGIGPNTTAVNMTGLLTVSGFGTHSFSAGGAGFNAIQVANTTSGAAARAYALITAGAVNAQLFAFSQGYTTGTWDRQAATALYADGAGGINLVAADASGAIRFYTGGTTQRWVIGTDGTLTGANNIIEIGASTYRATGATGTAYMGYVTSQAQFEILFNSTSVGVRLTSGANAWAALSDARLKTTLTPFTDAAATLRGVRTGTGRYLIDDSSISRSFMIAQDFETGLPEAITRDETDGMLMLRYTDTIPLIISGWQQHDATISQLAARIAALEGRQ